MTLLDRIRTWLGGLFGHTEPDADATPEETAEDRLDPDNVTQVRTDATDDSVAKLQDVRRRTTDEDVAGTDDDSNEGNEG